MLVSPSKIKINKILLNRTISFETVDKTHGNMVLIPSTEPEAIYDTLKGDLFRPSQLMSAYTKRLIRPMGRSPERINQKDYYENLREKTNGRIKRGKTLMSSYNGWNLFYDISNIYDINYRIFRQRFGNAKGPRIQNPMYEILEQSIYEASSDPDYENVYIVFPLVKPFENFQKTIIGTFDLETTDPLALFFRAIDKKLIDINKYSKVKKIFFYVPKGNVMLAMDLFSPDFDKELLQIKQKLRKLNNFVAGTETVEDEDDEISPEDRIENKKEEIKNVVFSKVAKTIKANNLTDFEAANRDERDLMFALDKKVDDYIKKPENMSKTVNDMVSDLEQDNEIKMKALRFVETKKASIIRANSMSKQLEKETEIIGSLQDLDEESKTNEPEKYKINIPYMDERMEQSHLASFDEEYNKKQAMTDISNIVSSFSNNEYSPIVVDSVEYEDSDNDTDMKKTLHVKYKTDDNKNLSFQIDVPKIVDKRYLYLGNNKKVIKKQLVRLPIVKTKNDRVEITTNYQKMTLERTNGNLSRKNMYLLKLLKGSTNKAYQIEYGDNSITNAKMGYNNDFEYEELASYISKVTTPQYTLIFNRDAIGDEIALLNIPDNFLGEKRTPIGFRLVSDEIESLLFIENRKVFKYNILTKLISEAAPSLFDFLAYQVFKLDMSNIPKISNNFIYTKLKFLQTTYPLFPVVASQVGITSILNRYKVEYHLSAKQEKRNPEYIEVKFKDCFLYFKDEMKNALLLNAIYGMNPEEFNFNDFDMDVPYTKYFMNLLGDSIGIHTRNTLRINLSVMIDPITRDILRDLHLPTDIIDVLLYANTLLVGNQYKPLNDMTNWRIRSNEIVADVLYGILAGAYVSYAKHKINGRPINLQVPKGALISKLQMEPNINDKSTLNPIIEAEQIAQMSAKGYRGVNINSAFTLEMRAYSDSMQGIVSGNSTPFSGQAGITRAITYDPLITSVRGYIPEKDKDQELNAANILSPTELLSSFTAAGADSPRQAMQVAQTGHTLPVLHSSKQLIGSGMNKTLAYIISDDFCFKAKKPGIVEKIDSKNNIAILKYNDGAYDAIDLDDKLNKNSGMGFYIHQLFKIVYAEGEHFDEGDVIAYNPSYFTGKGKNVDYQPGALAKIAIASGDFSFEDSTIISETLSQKCSSKVNMLKQAVLGKNATIYNIVKKGDTVKTGENLIEFTSSFDDPDTAEFLAKLQSSMSSEQINEIVHESIKAKYTGEITKVDIFYNCPFEQLSPSLQKLIRNYQGMLSSRANAVKGIPHNNVHIPPLEQTDAKKIGKESFPDDGGVIINIYIEYIDELGMGDKITYNTALKGVVSKVLSKDEAPLCDYRPEEPIEAILTPTGIISRMTTDIYSFIYSTKVLVECGKQIREIWNGER